MIFSALGGTPLPRKGLVLPEKWTKRVSEGHQMPSMVMWRLQTILCVFTQSHFVSFIAYRPENSRKRRQCFRIPWAYAEGTFLGLGPLFSLPVLQVMHQRTSKTESKHWKCWHFENSGHGEEILSWFGESVKSRRARYDASGTPTKVKTVIDRYEKRLRIFTFTATLEFHTFCSVQNIKSFCVHCSREIDVFRHDPFAHNHN
jgi:hypothetical protein